MLGDENTLLDTPYGPQDKAVAEHFFTQSYAELLGLARTRRRRAGLADTIQTTDVLHESYLKLTGRTVWQSQQHFLRTAALAIRQVVVDHARSKLSAKRGGGAPFLPLDGNEALLPEFGESPEEICGIGELLRRLENENPRWMRVIDCRYFAGMTEAETAWSLGVSERTVRRDWSDARDWLASQMS